jgi:hypothetical protein
MDKKKQDPGLKFRIRNPQSLPLFFLVNFIVSLLFVFVILQMYEKYGIVLFDAFLIRGVSE